MLRRMVLAGVVLAVFFAAGLYVVGTGVFGRHWAPGLPNGDRRPPAVVAQRVRAQRAAGEALGVARPKQILFGDFHVHTTFSLDAFMMALPPTGEGAHPVNDACDFARYCSALDFWSINDHAISLTPRDWKETVDAVRECNAVGADATDPDVVAFLGWEWTQIGTRPENHYGHKNVIFRDLDDDHIPTRPIAATAPPDAVDRQQGNVPSPFAFGMLALTRPGQSSMDLIRFFRDMTGVPNCPDGVPERELPTTCHEWAATPADLFAKLDDWGYDSIVIPHGTTWGYYTPMGSAWDKQLVGKEDDPRRQILIEVYSGHGNSEEYRDFEEVIFHPDGTATCPSPTAEYLPSCWQAGEIIRERCSAAGESAKECEQRAAEARQRYVDAGISGHLTVPGAKASDWLDSGQCRDCFLPAFNYRPKSSVQYIMALRNFDDPANPRRFDFGFIASSDNHSARPGTGYKEFDRLHMTEARLTEAAGEFMGRPPEQAPAPRSRPFDPATSRIPFFTRREAERASAYMLTGGLVAVHSAGRDREAIWDALQRREVYGTSGPRILLWFDLLNPPGSSGVTVPMGGHVKMGESPIFQVRAVGAFEQEPGCPKEAVDALGEDGIQRLCRGECYNPSDRRRLISRIEVVRIRPQTHPGEPVAGLVDDPWRVLPCQPDPAGCSVTFTDPDFAASGRDALYYVRAIEAPSMAVAADPLRCERDAKGNCTEVHLCGTGEDAGGDCLAMTEERAWSSPIFVAPAGAVGQAAAAAAAAPGAAAPPAAPEEAAGPAGSPEQSSGAAGTESPASP